VAIGSPGGGQLNGTTPLPARGLGEAVAVALGQDQVGVVQQPVHGHGGQGLGHDLIELTPLGLRVVAGVGLDRITQQVATCRGRLPTDPTGQVRWAG
jgi:hypothetical protein